MSTTAHRDDPPWWRVIGWWAVDYAYAGWRQLAVLGVRHPRRLLRGDAALPEIVLLPGVYEHWTFLRPLAARLNAAGFRVRTVHGLGANVRPIPETAARLERALARIAKPAAGRVVVGHSKGGLIGKQLLVDGADLDGVVAISSPFNGTRRARFFLDPVVREFLPGEPAIAALRAADSVDARIVSISGLFDPHVPEGSEIEGAHNVRVPVAGHFRILGAPETAEAVRTAVLGLAPS